MGQNFKSFTCLKTTLLISSGNFLLYGLFKIFVKASFWARVNILFMVFHISVQHKVRMAYKIYIHR